MIRGKSKTIKAIAFTGSGHAWPDLAFHFIKTSIMQAALQTTSTNKIYPREKYAFTFKKTQTGKLP